MCHKEPARGKQIMAVYSAESGRGGRHYKGFFSMNSGQNKEFKKKLHVLGDILHILGGFRGKFGKIRISWQNIHP